MRVSRNCCIVRLGEEDRHAFQKITMKIMAENNKNYKFTISTRLKADSYKREYAEITNFLFCNKALCEWSF